MTGRPGGITILMHERKAGYANNGWSMAGLANKAWGEGVRIEAGIKVTGLRLVAGAVTAVETNEGTVKLETLVVGVGPWIKYLWAMLDLPKKISVNYNGERHDNVPMWTYWVLQEGTLQVDARRQLTNDGKHPRSFTSTRTCRFVPISMASSSATGGGGSITNRMSIWVASRAVAYLTKSTQMPTT